MLGGSGTREAGGLAQLSFKHGMFDQLSLGRGALT